MGEEHHGAAGAGDRQRRLQRPRAAHRVEDGVRAQVSGELRYRAPGRLARRRRRVGAQPPGDREALLQGIGDGDPQVRVDRLQHQQMEQPHAAATEDRGAAFSQARVADAAQHAGGRLQEDRGLIRKVGGQAESGCADGALAHQHPFGEAARHQQVLAESGAERLIAAPAESAFAACRVVGDGDAVPRREPLDPLAQGRDGADDLVPEHRAGGGRAVAQLEEIGAAEAGAAQAQEHLARPGHGARAALDPHHPPAGAGDDGHRDGLEEG